MPADSTPYKIFLHQKLQLKLLRPGIGMKCKNQNWEMNL